MADNPESSAAAWQPIELGKAAFALKEPRRVGFVSLGCPKNLVDSEVMLGTLKRRGHEITNDVASADVIVVNTCAFIDRAKKESIDTVLEMARLKTRGPGGAPRRLVVTGCLAERHDKDLRLEIPEIDATLGTGQIPQHGVRQIELAVFQDVHLDAFEHTEIPELLVEAVDFGHLLAQASLVEAIDDL